VGVSENSGFFPPKSSILIGFSIINHPFWGTPIFGNTHVGLDRFFTVVAGQPWIFHDTFASQHGDLETAIFG